MKSRIEFKRIVARARREALAIVRDEVARAFSESHTLHIAVGWGIVVLDDATGKSFPMSRSQQAVALLAADFSDIFDPGNERLKGKRCIAVEVAGIPVIRATALRSK